MSDKHVQRAKIVEKVRALLTMTVKNGCTEAEAMTAAAMAARLMEQYDLALTEMKSVHDERIAREAKPFSSTEQSRQMHAAGIYVAVTVAEFFDCKCWRNHTEIVFFGMKDDVELAHMMLAMIRFAMDRELGDFLKTGSAKGEHRRSVAASFAKGMGHRICVRLRLLKAQRTANVRAKGKDLVVVKNEVVDAAFAKLFQGMPLKKARPTKPSKSDIAYAAGVEAGDRVDIGDGPRIEQSAKPQRRRRSRAATKPGNPLDRPSINRPDAMRGNDHLTATVRFNREAAIRVRMVLASLGGAALVMLKSFAWLALIFLGLSSNAALFPDSFTRLLLWLDSAGALAPLGIAMLILVPVVRMWWKTSRGTSR